MLENDRFKIETEDFFNRYAKIKKVDTTLNDLDNFLMKYYCLNISQFLLNTINKNIVEVDQNTKILDIGCGAGDYLIYLSNHFKYGQYYGVDTSESAINQAITNSKKSELISVDPYLLNFSYEVNPINLKFYKSDGADLTFEANYFDLVYCIMILHHTHDYENIIKEAHRVLKTGGIFIVIDFKDHNFLNKLLIKYCFKVLALSIRKKLFKNDLILYNGDIPLRSDVCFNKIHAILNHLKMIELDVSVNYLIMNYLILVIKLFYNKYLFNIIKPIFYVIIFCEKKLKPLFKNKYESYAMVYRKL